MERRIVTDQTTEAPEAGQATEATQVPVSAKKNVVVPQLKKPVFLVGFMGAGKTSVARRVARSSHVASIDMDAYIERREGRKVASIFADDGEEQFRSIESEVLEELTLKDPLLVSCGGGIVLKEENRRLLIERGFVIYLEVSADEAAHRISDASTRPLFQDIENARATNMRREPLYEEVADATVDTIGKNIAQIAREVKEILQKEGILWQAPE